jgi:hypothetical protein
MVCAHISKYIDIGNHLGIIAVKYAKKSEKMKDIGRLMYTWSVRTFPNIVTLAIRDETQL